MKVEGEVAHTHTRARAHTHLQVKGEVAFRQQREVLGKGRVHGREEVLDRPRPRGACEGQ